MRSFVLSIPAKLRLKDEELDARSVLCSKSWEVFNDEGIKQIFIFNDDGTLLISTNGSVVYSSWKYLSLNRSLIITGNSGATMYRPAFLDENILALQKDGTEELVCMIDENNKDLFPVCTVEALESYFKQKALAQQQVESLKQSKPAPEVKASESTNISAPERSDEASSMEENVVDEYVEDGTYWVTLFCVGIIIIGLLLLCLAL